MHYAVAGGPRKPKESGIEELKLLAASANCSIKEKKTELLILLSAIKGFSTTRSSHWHWIEGVFIFCWWAWPGTGLYLVSLWLANTLCKTFLGVMLKAKINSVNAAKYFFMIWSCIKKIDWCCKYTFCNNIAKNNIW